MQNILILTERNVSLAPRIIREYNLLKDFYNVHVCGAQSSNCEISNYISLYSLRSFADKVLSRLDKLCNKIQLRYSDIAPIITNNKIEVVIIHDPLFIPIAIRLKTKFGLKIIFNAHEYHPLEFEDDEHWMKNEGKLYHSLYKNLLPNFDLIVNVCESIRQKCITDYQLPSIVIPNASDFHQLIPSVNSTNRIRVIHHGALLPGRKIEKMIEVVGALNSTHELDIIGVYNAETTAYYNQLITLCEKFENVRLLQPVPFNKIVETINQYDIGLYLLEPSNFNNYHALPNKLFEFIQARLVLVVSPSPEMEKIVNTYEIGAVASDFSVNAMKEALLSIDKKDILRYKRNSDNAASIENAKKYYELYLNSVLSLLKN